VTITVQEYFGSKAHTQAHEAAATDLLLRVNALCSSLGYDPPVDPDTGTQISGSRGGNGDGGFRLMTATTGRAHSSHKEAKGVDVYDPEGTLDGAISDEVLARFGLYREAPDATATWCHMTTRPPGSGNRTFEP
jgi:hypothetical protein